MPKNPFNMETIEPENNQTIEIQYNCTECESHIEIISINENENTIEFQCIKNNHKKKIQIKDYLSKIKHHNDKNANDDKCSEHNNLIYQTYCLECKKHLCKECLKLRKHINHTKNNIIEIQPKEQEIKNFNKIIEYYDNEIKKIEKDNLKKSEKIREELNKYKNKLNNIKETKKKKCYNNMMIELKINKDKYLQELKALKNKYAQEIKTMKNKYEINNNKIRNKYKLNNEYQNILYTTKIQNLEKIYNKIIQKDYGFKKIKDVENIKRLNQIILQTYDFHKNNYYNSININNILFSNKSKFNFDIIKINKEYKQINKKEIIKKEYEEGNYEGEINDGKREGKGIMIYKNGDKYEGNFKNDKIEGKGIYYFNSGNRYEGESKNGIKEGKGIMYFANGNKYEGDWKNDKRKGKGIFYYNNGDRYEGDFIDNKFDGNGIYFYKNGNRDMGDYSKGEKIGKHVILTNNGQVKIVQKE